MCLSRAAFGFISSSLFDFFRFLNFVAVLLYASFPTPLLLLYPTPLDSFFFLLKDQFSYCDSFLNPMINCLVRWFECDNCKQNNLRDEQDSCS
ncbi:hypothetical protein V6N12_013068 [Hibiscus sabdariffa]|uniref:Uncharacterized protein n=1 Tax=Hibiscus sabdariffa TaxID=183260 RepID=A0ABR2EG82_9ROSI